MRTLFSRIWLPLLQFCSNLVPKHSLIFRWRLAQRAKITEKIHKPLWNHYIEWPVFSDIGLNFEKKKKKGRTCKKYKILIGSWVPFFPLKHALPFSPGYPLKSKGSFVNLFGDLRPVCGGGGVPGVSKNHIFFSQMKVFSFCAKIAPKRHKLQKPSK